jgi:hypothetical protein
LLASPKQTAIVGEVLRDVKSRSIEQSSATKTQSVIEREVLSSDNANASATKQFLVRDPRDNVIKKYIILKKPDSGQPAIVQHSKLAENNYTQTAATTSKQSANVRQVLSSDNANASATKQLLVRDPKDNVIKKYIILKKPESGQPAIVQQSNLANKNAQTATTTKMESANVRQVLSNPHSSATKQLVVRDRRDEKTICTQNIKKLYQERSNSFNGQENNKKNNILRRSISERNEPVHVEIKKNKVVRNEIDEIICK